MLQMCKYARVEYMEYFFGISGIYCMRMMLIWLQTVKTQHLSHGSFEWKRSWSGPKCYQIHSHCLPPAGLFLQHSFCQAEAQLSNCSALTGWWQPVTNHCPSHVCSLVFPPPHLMRPALVLGD